MEAERELVPPLSSWGAGTAWKESRILEGNTPKSSFLAGAATIPAGWSREFSPLLWDVAVPHSEGPKQAWVRPGGLAHPCHPWSCPGCHPALSPRYLAQLGHPGDVPGRLGALVGVVLTEEVINLVLVRLLVPQRGGLDKLRVWGGKGQGSELISSGKPAVGTGQGMGHRERTAPA